MNPRELIPEHYYSVPLLYLGGNMFSDRLGSSEIIELDEDKIRDIPHRCNSLGKPLPVFPDKPAH
jgi:hypothetical protein